MSYVIPTRGEAEDRFSKSVRAFPSNQLDQIKRKIVEAFIDGCNLVEISCPVRGGWLLTELWTFRIYPDFLKADPSWEQVLAVKISDNKIICYFNK